MDCFPAFSTKCTVKNWRKFSSLLGLSKHAPFPGPSLFPTRFLVWVPGLGTGLQRVNPAINEPMNEQTNKRTNQTNQARNTHGKGMDAKRAAFDLHAKMYLEKTCTSKPREGQRARWKGGCLRGVSASIHRPHSLHGIQNRLPRCKHLDMRILRWEFMGLP